MSPADGADRKNRGKRLRKGKKARRQPGKNLVFMRVSGKTCQLNKKNYTILKKTFAKSGVLYYTISRSPRENKKDGYKDGNDVGNMERSCIRRRAGEEAAGRALEQIFPD